MTSLSDGLGPQKDPNSGRTRVESGPAGTHRPTTRRGSAIVFGWSIRRPLDQNPFENSEPSVSLDPLDLCRIPVDRVAVQQF